MSDSDKSVEDGGTEPDPQPSSDDAVNLGDAMNLDDAVTSDHAVTSGDGEIFYDPANPADAEISDDAETPQRQRSEGVPSKTLARLAFGFGLAYLLITFADVWWTGNRPTEASAPAAVVLGAAQYDGEPSAVLKGRLDRAAELWRDGRVELVVVTGGGQETDITTEAKTGYDYLRETTDMADDDLRLEVQGSSTYESLAAVSRFLIAEDVTDVILVTDRYHARRSQLIAAEVGLDALVYPTESSSSIDRLVQESAAVAVGRIISFRRVDSYLAG